MKIWESTQFKCLSPQWLGGYVAFRTQSPYGDSTIVRMLTKVTSLLNPSFLFHLKSGMDGFGIPEDVQDSGITLRHVQGMEISQLCARQVLYPLWYFSRNFGYFPKTHLLRKWWMWSVQDEHKQKYCPEQSGSTSASALLIFPLMKFKSLITQVIPFPDCRKGRSVSMCSGFWD